MEKKNKRKKKIDIDKIINFRFTLFLILIILLFAMLFIKITSVMVVDKKEYSQKLKADGADAVILTSTWGTCTRCGATMVKEIERAGIPVVHICTVTPISMTVGANRIVPAVAIPHPLGNPALDKEEEKKLRRQIVEKALKALTTEVDGQTIFE